MNLIGIDIFLTIQIMLLISHWILLHIIFMLWAIIVLIQTIGNPFLVSSIHSHPKLKRLKKYAKVCRLKHEQPLTNWV